MPKELILKGRVQGVFCRHYSSENAKRLDLQGAASNLANGTVQLLIDSDDDVKIARLVGALRENPYGIRFYGTITGIEVNNYEGPIRGDYVF